MVDHVADVRYEEVEKSVHLFEWRHGTVAAITASTQGQTVKGSRSIKHICTNFDQNHYTLVQVH